MTTYPFPGIPAAVRQISSFFLTCYTEGVSSHGKPGKVMEFHFLFPGLEKSWNLTPGFGKFMKVMEIIWHPLAKLRGSVPHKTFRLVLQHSDTLWVCQA